MRYKNPLDLLKTDAISVFTQKRNECNSFMKFRRMEYYENSACFTKISFVQCSKMHPVNTSYELNLRSYKFAWISKIFMMIHTLHYQGQRYILGGIPFSLTNLFMLEKIVLFGELLRSSKKSNISDFSRYRKKWNHILCFKTFCTNLIPCLYITQFVCSSECL